MMDIDTQVEILLQGTRFADEADFDTPSDLGQSLRKQMTAELRTKLKQGKPLRVYLGVDPTGSHLHIGHFVPLQKLKKFQDLGHHVIFLIGDYTAMIGDPSGRSEGRDKLTHDQVLELARTYQDQAFRILDRARTEVRYNSEWLSKLGFADIVELAAMFPLKQIVSRRDFQQRMESGKSLRFHEAIYSLMQGYDAYALQCDVQVGAYDQHFNMLSGRTLQTYFKQTPHVMLTNPLLIGTDGRKMSKSFGNTIDIEDNPFDMYGKTMRIADEYLPEFLELAGSFQPREIAEMIAAIASGTNPMEIKKKLALNIVSMYHGRDVANKAEQDFSAIVQKKEIPDELPRVSIPKHLTRARWVDLLTELGLIKSKSEARRLIEQSGFYIDQHQMKDINAHCSFGDREQLIIRIGKRGYYQLTIDGS